MTTTNFNNFIFQLYKNYAVCIIKLYFYFNCFLVVKIRNYYFSSQNFLINFYYTYYEEPQTFFPVFLSQRYVFVSMIYDECKYSHSVYIKKYNYIQFVFFFLLKHQAPINQTQISVKSNVEVYFKCYLVQKENTLFKIFQPIKNFYNSQKFLKYQI